MRVSCVLVWCVALALCSAAASATGVKPTRAEAEAAQIPAGAETHTVVARTMVRAKIVAPPPPPPSEAELDEAVEAAPKPAVAAAAKKSVKAQASKKVKAVVGGKQQKQAAKAGSKKADNKKKAAADKPKPKAKAAQPGAASAAAVAAAPKAPKDELIKWVRAHAPLGTTDAELKKIELYLNGQIIHTFEDLISRGEEGIKALLVGEVWRNKFLEVLIDHIGKSRGVDDGMLVPTPPLRKAEPKKKCDKKKEEQPRFVSIPVNNAAPAPVGDWLRRAFPTYKPLRMSRTILALERQSIRTFADLERVGLDGVGRLLYVPDGVREALRDAIIYHIGTQGHDDGKFVAAQRYVPPPPPKDECA